MTEPATPTWLRPADVLRWLQLTSPTPEQSALVGMCAAAVEPQVERARPDQWATDIESPINYAGGSGSVARTYVPDAEVYQAGVMLAARLWRRRNSPGGIEAFAESVAYVSRYDPEIERALRVGVWRRGRVG